MKDSWNHYMKVGIVHPMAFPEVLGGEGPILESLQRIAEDEFFGAIDIVWVKDPGTRKRAAALLRHSRLEVTFAAQSVLLLGKHDLNSTNREVRHRAIDLVKACIEQASDLGANRISLLSGYDPGVAGRPEGTRLLIDSLQQVCAYAREKAGLPVALKVFDRDVEKRSLIGPAAEAYALACAVKVDFPDFGLIHDLSHLPLLGERPAEALPILREHLVQMHMGNSVSDPSHPLYGDTHPVFGVPGSDSDVEELTDYLKTLFDVGFLGVGRRPFMGFEIKPQADFTSEMVIANAKRTLRDAWAALEL